MCRAILLCEYVDKNEFEKWKVLIRRTFATHRAQEIKSDLKRVKERLSPLYME